MLFHTYVSKGWTLKELLSITYHLVIEMTEETSLCQNKMFMLNENSSLQVHLFGSRFDLQSQAEHILSHFVFLQQSWDKPEHTQQTGLSDVYKI